MPRPSQVVTAIKLVALNTVVGFISIAFAWDYYTGIQSPTTILISQALGLAFTIFLYYNIYAGRNWARILLLILFVLGALVLSISSVALTTALTSGPLHSRIIRGIGLLITLYVLWLLFISPGRLWFRKGVSQSVA